MRVPSSINKNTLKTYNPVEFIRNKYPVCNLENWDSQIPRPLHKLCVECIAKHWKENPILDEIVLSIDRYLLLDLLPSDLPLEITIPIIPDEIFWKRCYLERWPKILPDISRDVEVYDLVRNTDSIRKLSSVIDPLECSGSKNESVRSSRRSSRISKTSSKVKSQDSCEKSSIDEEGEISNVPSWKQCYIEMHLNEYFQKLKPEEYVPEKIKILSDLCSKYVKALRIEELQCSRNSRNKIPLNSILAGFKRLKEFSVCFKQAYAKDEFSWNIVNTSLQDIITFAKGLSFINLNVLRVTNSDIDCEKAIIILRALRKHNLEILDFSHCKIGNKGFIGISKFIIDGSLKNLSLCNNRASLKGYEALSYALSKDECTLQILNLRLNSIRDEAGNILMRVLKYKGKHIISLNISGCGFSKELDISDMLAINNTLEILDVSNNNLRDETGIKLLEALKTNNCLKKLDVRMCKISSDVELKIHDKVHGNKLKKREEYDKKEYDNFNFKWSENLILEIDSVFDEENETNN